MLPAGGPELPLEIRTVRRKGKCLFPLLLCVLMQTIFIQSSKVWFYPGVVRPAPLLAGKENIVALVTVKENIVELVTVKENIVALVTVKENIVALVTVTENIEALVTVKENIVALVTVICFGGFEPFAVGCFSTVLYSCSQLYFV